jgi:nitrite reductase/ring-hydroxylating ferredoxin subunit
VVDFAGLDAAIWAPSTGWYRLGAAPAPGAVSSFGFGDRALVAWTDTAGRTTVADARCPHFGADLGRGGTVVADCLQCPFHGWRYGADGRHLGTVGGDGATAARLRLLPSAVVTGTVHVFHGPSDREPWAPAAETWAAEAAAAADGGAITEPSIIVRDTPAPPVIVAEGAFDLAHFAAVHDVEPDGVAWGFEGPTAWVRFALGTGRRALHYRFDLDGLSSLRETVARDRYVLARTIWHEPTPTGWRSRLEATATGPQPRAAAALARELDRAAADDYTADEVIWGHRAFTHPSVYGPADRALRDFRAWARPFLEDGP